MEGLQKPQWKARWCFMLLLIWYFIDLLEPMRSVSSAHKLSRRVSLSDGSQCPDCQRKQQSTVIQYGAKIPNRYSVSAVLHWDTIVSIDRMTWPDVASLLIDSFRPCLMLYTWLLVLFDLFTVIELQPAVVRKISLCPQGYRGTRLKWLGCKQLHSVAKR